MTEGYSTRTATQVSTLPLVRSHTSSLGVPAEEKLTNLTKWPHMSPLSLLMTFFARQPRKGWASLFGLPHVSTTGYL